MGVEHLLKPYFVVVSTFNTAPCRSDAIGSRLRLVPNNRHGQRDRTVVDCGLIDGDTVDDDLHLVIDAHWGDLDHKLLQSLTENYLLHNV